jgi:2-dehydro-3-deoxyglucarate aldolase
MLKKKLANKEISIGSWLTIGHQAVVEIMATAGFEWLTIDMEHSSLDYENAYNLIAHIQANGIEALVRVSKNEEVAIKKVMDAGANGVIVPMIKNKQEAELAVSYVKYPPVGKRGVGLNRAQKWGTDFAGYKEWTDNEAVVIAQIEHIEAVNNLEDILKTEGIDGVIVGPYDLSASMGYPGEYDRDDVKAAFERVVEVTKKSNKSLGFHVIESRYSNLKERMSQGYTFLAFSLDFFFLGDRAREEMIKFKEDL